MRRARSMYRAPASVSVTERVVRTATVPVLTVRPRCGADDADHRTAAERLLEDESTG